MPSVDMFNFFGQVVMVIVNLVVCFTWKCFPILFLGLAEVSAELHCSCIGCGAVGSLSSHRQHFF